MKGLHFFYPLVYLIILSSCGNMKQELINQIPFDFDWKFVNGEQPGAEHPQFDDSAWQLLDVPHDFSIEQPFDSINKSGGGGGFAYGGIGWYRKQFSLDKGDEGKKVFILFDGVYRNSEVWINGHYLGIRPYGYSSFYYDLTPHLNSAGETNVLAVKVNTTNQPNSRWYTGAGIYRHVWLIKKEQLRIDQWGVFAHTKKSDHNLAEIDVAVEIINDFAREKKCDVITTLYNEQGEKITTTSSTLTIQSGDTIVLSQNLLVKQPKLWSTNTPNLYQLKVELKSNGKFTDQYITSFGIRTFHFDPDKGFFLNGEHLRLKGVNNHHDGGPLGAACMDYTHERQLAILKEMGCNAIRISHNPPSPELLQMADKLGFVVINEIFDEWLDGKTPFGYSSHFMEWYQRDVANWVRRDRNHASVIAWSIGNEVYEQWNPTKGPMVVKMLIDAAGTYDKTRPFTAGCNVIPAVNESGFGELLGIVGYNYQEAMYEQDHARFPNRIIYGSETTPYPYQPGDCSQMHSYTDWVTSITAEFVAGEFLWTGFDYIGEAGIGDVGTGCEPWNQWPGWPWRGASCGVVDMCGFEKAGFWFRKALWSNEPMVYLAVQTDPSAKNREVVPFWGWPKVEHHWNHNMEDEILTVHVYTNVPDVELFINDTSFGSKHWDINNEAFLTWEVPYKKGVIKAVGKTATGISVENKIQTAGEVAKIQITADRPVLKANRQDLSYITVQLLDADNIPVPFANNLIEFEVSGMGKLAGVGNGNQMSHTSLKGTKMETFLGKCLAIVQSGDKPGEIKITAKSENIPSQTIAISVQ